MFTNEEISIANKTSRSRGVIGVNAIVPRIVMEMIDMHSLDGVEVLDFGAGKDAMHAQNLRANGVDVTAYEFGDNINPDLHDANALDRKYDIVYASNVLNVQSSVEMFRTTLKQVASSMKEHGIFIANYPNSPRKSDLTTDQVVDLLTEHFDTIEWIKKSKSAPVWMLGFE